MYPTTSFPETELREARKKWAREYHGTLARIARKLKVNRQQVWRVLYGAPTANGAIERELAEAGAPGMAERLESRRIA